MIVYPELHGEGLNLGGGGFFKETLSGEDCLQMPENGKLRTQNTRFGIFSFHLFFFLVCSALSILKHSTSDLLSLSF